MCPPSPKDLDELKTRITDAVNAVTQDMIGNVWEEFEYRIDIRRAASEDVISNICNLTLLKLDYF